MRLLITLPRWKRKLIPLDGILWMRRWPVATAEETDVCSQCRKSGGEDFLGAVEEVEKEEEEEKAAQRSTQLPLEPHEQTQPRTAPPPLTASDIG